MHTQVCAYLALTAITLAASAAPRRGASSMQPLHAWLPLLPLGRRAWAAVLQEVVLVALTLPNQVTLLMYLWNQKVGDLCLYGCLCSV
jgi:hypothetical protein